MRASFLHRLTGWLALVAGLLLGAAPSQAMVLCFEPDGTVALELAGRSGPCDDEGPCRDAGSALAAPVSECCACLDIPVGGHGDETRVPPAGVALLFDAPLALASIVSLAPPVPRLEREHGGAPPGTAGALVHVRTNVLRL